MGAQDLKQIFLSRFPAQWDQISTEVSKPIIAAVNGFAVSLFTFSDFEVLTFCCSSAADARFR